MSDFRPRVQFLAGAFQPLLALIYRFGGPLLLLALMALSFWRILFTGQYSWLNSFDLSSQVLPWLQFQAGEWHAGRFPQWSPYEWGGQNLIGQAQPGVVNPLYWLLFLAPLKRGWLREGALNWWFYGLHALAALNLYWLARSLGTTRLAAIAGGLVFGLFGFMGAIDWPQMISGLVWAPLVFLFLFQGTQAEGIRQSAYSAAAGLFLGLAWLSGHHQVPIFVSLAVGGSIAALRFWPGILTFIVAGLVGAAQILPAMLYGRHARRWVGMEDTVGWKDPVAYYVHEQYSNLPSSLLGILLPGKDTHTGFFLGMTALGLALAAVYRQWERREVRVLFGIGLAGMFYALGRSGLLEPLLYSFVPMVEKARNPSMAVSVFTLGFAPLAAIGLDEIRRAGIPQQLLKAHWIFGGAAVALFSLGLLTAPGQNRLEERWMMAGVLSLLVAWLYSAKPKASLLAAAILAVLLVEASNYTYYNMGNRHDPAVSSLIKPMGAHLDLREYLAGQPGPVRITIDDKVIGYNFGDWHGVDVMGGYLASLSDNLHEVEIYGERARQILGIGFHLGHGPPDFAPDSTLAYAGQSGVNVYRYPAAPLPRARLVHRTIQYNTKSDYNVLVNQEGLDLRQVALTREAVGGLEDCPEQSAAESASILLREPGRVVIRVNAACRALALLADTDDAGWSVSVDGKAARKITVHEFLRAVVVEKGIHTIEWRYRAPGLATGTAMGFAGLLIAGVYWFRARRSSSAAVNTRS